MYSRKSNYKITLQSLPDVLLRQLCFYLDGKDLNYLVAINKRLNNLISQKIPKLSEIHLKWQIREGTNNYRRKVIAKWNKLSQEENRAKEYKTCCELVSDGDIKCSIPGLVTYGCAGDVILGNGLCQCVPWFCSCPAACPPPACSIATPAACATISCGPCPCHPCAIPCLVGYAMMGASALITSIHCFFAKKTNNKWLDLTEKKSEAKKEFNLVDSIVDQRIFWLKYKLNNLTERKNTQSETKTDSTTLSHII